MGCHEIIRELSVPTDERDQAALAAHLENCPDCVDWVKRDMQFDRVWKLTRPSEPTARVWDEVWARLTLSLNELVATDVDLLAPHASSSIELTAGHEKMNRGSAHLSTNIRNYQKKWIRIGLITLAQAAVLFIVVTLGWHWSMRSQRANLAAMPGQLPSPFVLHMTTAPNSPRTANDIEIEEGQVVIIRFEGSAAKMLDCTPQPTVSKIKHAPVQPRGSSR